MKGKARTRPAAAQVKSKRQSAKKSRSRATTTRTVVALLGVAIVGLVLGGAVFYGRKSGPAGGQSRFASIFTPREPLSVFYDFPRVTADLSRADGLYAVAKVRISAEFDDADLLAEVHQAQPKIVGGMQTFLNSKTVTDLQGGRGTDLMRQGFLGIVNSAIHPSAARSILFREIVIH
jgi:flagellar basal body-associated protein FliL